jgi:hypothetical protein
MKIIVNSVHIVSAISVSVTIVSLRVSGWYGLEKEKKIIL